MAKKKQEEDVKPKEVFKPKPKKTCDISKLGTRTFNKPTLTEVKVGETDGGRDVVKWQNVQKKVTEVTPDITLDEAVLLNECHGPIEWNLWHDTTKFYTKVGGRRLFITKEIHDNLGK